MPQEKLIRDKMPRIAIECDNPMNTRIASEEEFRGFLRKKLIEEAIEVGDEIKSGDKTKLIEELADVIEVITAIRIRFGIRDIDVSDAQSKKLSKKGGFYDGVIWDGTRKDSSQ